MIINLTGQAGSGKTSIAKELLKLIPKSINIDGDELRKVFDNKDYSNFGRRNNMEQAYNIALFLESQGYVPIISLISPYKDIRELLKLKTNVLEAYVFTSDVRGKEKYFVSDYLKPTNKFINIDTTNTEASKLAYEIFTNFQNGLYENLYTK